jgi:hypothetical protein
MQHGVALSHNPRPQKHKTPGGVAGGSDLGRSRSGLTGFVKPHMQQSLWPPGPTLWKTEVLTAKSGNLMWKNRGPRFLRNDESFNGPAPQTSRGTPSLGLHLHDGLG